MVVHADLFHLEGGVMKDTLGILRGEEVHQSVEAALLGSFVQVLLSEVISHVDGHTGRD